MRRLESTSGPGTESGRRRPGECLDRAEGAAERPGGDDGRSMREALDDASEIVARAPRRRSPGDEADGEHAAGA
jgi:hypothetical protein